ncbi:hypothetical protein EI94DRAFT_1709850 [Lactarius quietus]|nr:hypothetical protein EI94DRAFT_1709850 [Lactarius quietus]
MHEHWKDCQDYPEAHKWVGKDPEYDEEEQVRALVWSQGTDEEDYIGEGEALRIAQLIMEDHGRHEIGCGIPDSRRSGQFPVWVDSDGSQMVVFISDSCEAVCLMDYKVTIPASANVALKTDCKTKDIGKYEDAALMPSMMELSTPTTSMHMPRTEQARVVSRAPRKSTRVSEAELFNQHWKQIKDDFILEEKFTKWNLRRLRRSLELWQEAVEEEVRQNIAAEAVLKLSSDGPHTPSRNSPTPDEEAERPWGWQFNYDESDEEEPGKAIEYVEGPDSDDEEEPGEAEEQYTEEDPDEEETITADDEAMYPPWILHPKEVRAPEEAEEYPTETQIRRPRRDNNTSQEEEVPDEAEEYVEDVKSPAVAEKEEEETKEDDGYDEDWMGPRGEYTPFDPKFINSKYFREMPTEPTEGLIPGSNKSRPRSSRWPSITKQPLFYLSLQYGIDMRKTFQIHKFSWIPVQEEGVRDSPLQVKESVPLWTSKKQPRCRARAITREGIEDAFRRFKRTGSPKQQDRQKSRRVRFSAQKKVKVFKRESPPSDVRSQFLSPHSDAGHLSRTVLVERLRGRSPEREVMSRSDIILPSDNVKTRRCMHEHWKDCQDYPEAHKWVGKDPEYDEEEQVRALVWSQGTDEEDYIGEGEALRIAQLVSGMLVHAEPSSAGTSTAGRMKTT